MRWAGNSKAWLATLACASVALTAIASAGTAVAAPLHRTCGILPGEGFYAYTKTVGITCRAADKIARRATRKFCARHHRCRYGLHTSPLLVRKGPITVNGWRCRIKQGYEFNDVRCHRREMSIHTQSAV